MCVCVCVCVYVCVTERESFGQGLAWCILETKVGRTCSTVCLYASDCSWKDFEWTID